MRDPSRQFLHRPLVVLGILIVGAVSHVALAASEEPTARQAVHKATPQTETPEPATAAVDAPAADTPVAKAAPPSGPEVYQAVCVACHAPPGIGGAPALGDSDAWAARIAQGMDTLKDHALHGFSGSAGIMPRKGGRTDLSDEEIIAAVEYMVEQATE